MIFKIIAPPQGAFRRRGTMTSENNIEITSEKAGLCEAHPNMDIKSKYVLKEISNVRWFDP